jgi:hypothetical protein
MDTAFASGLACDRLILHSYPSSGLQDSTTQHVAAGPDTTHQHYLIDVLHCSAAEKLRSWLLASKFAV